MTLCRRTGAGSWTYADQVSRPDNKGWSAHSRLLQVVGKQTKKLSLRLTNHKDPEKSLAAAEGVLAVLIRKHGSESKQAAVGRSEVPG